MQIYRTLDIPQWGNLRIRSFVESDAQVFYEYFCEGDRDFLIEIGGRPDLSPMPRKLIEERIQKIKDHPNHPKAENPVIFAELNRTLLASASFYRDPERPDVAEGHFHIFDASLRQKGLGKLIFENIEPVIASSFLLRKIIARPSATNEAINALLRSTSWTLRDSYETCTHPWARKMLVNHWEKEISGDSADRTFE